LVTPATASDHRCKDDKCIERNLVQRTIRNIKY